MFNKLQNHSLLYWIGLIGIIFYAISPVVMPHQPDLRQPELLPVYTLMIGVSQALKGNDTEDDED